MLTEQTVSELMLFARATAQRAGSEACRFFRQPLLIENKEGDSGFDPVTEADRNVERVIRESIESQYPTHGIVGEEFGEQRVDSDTQWIIDPIDGTRAFITGVPTWGVLMGLTHKGQCQGGLMHQPITGETFVANTEGAYFFQTGVAQDASGIAMHSSSVECLKEASLYCTHPSMFPNQGQRRAFNTLASRAKLQRYGGDCYSYCMLAMGCIDVVVEGLLQPYDIVPLIPLIQRSGGVVTDINGDLPVCGGTVIAAATAGLHAEALKIMQESY